MTLREEIVFIIDSERHNKQRTSIQITDEILKLFEQKIDEKIKERKPSGSTWDHYGLLALEELKQSLNE